MTVRQKQCLLCYLGYYDGLIDGIWGAKSQSAQQAFCKDYGVEDPWEDALKAAVSEGDWWSKIRYFTREEFACKCKKYCNGYPAPMDRKTVELAEEARRHFGKPAIVVSGLRCSNHNGAVGGVANSRHMTGKAVDLQIQGVSAKDLLSFLQKKTEVRYAYAINSTNVHFDVD